MTGAWILDVTTIRDLHTGLPRGTLGFVVRGQRYHLSSSSSIPSLPSTTVTPPPTTATSSSMTGSFVFAEDEGTAPDGTTTITKTITTVKVVTRTIYNDVSVSLNESYSTVVVMVVKSFCTSTLLRRTPLISRDTSLVRQPNKTRRVRYESWRTCRRILTQTVHYCGAHQTTATIALDIQIENRSFDSI